MTWIDIILAMYFVPMVAVLITAAVHGEHNSEEWRNMMGWLSITPIVNIYIMGCILTWYIWKGYHKVFKKKRK